MKLYTRRDMARLASIGVAGIATGGLAVEFPSSVSSRARGLLALKAQNWRASGGGGWTNPYITDGLVGHFDAIWNAGPDLHDAHAETWFNLAPNGADAVTAGDISAGWGDDSLTVTGNKPNCVDLPISLTSACTIEAVTSSMVLGNTIKYWGLCRADNNQVYDGYTQQWREFYFGLNTPNLRTTVAISSASARVYWGASLSSSGSRVWAYPEAGGPASDSTVADFSRVSKVRVNWSNTASSYPRIMHACRIYDRILSDDEIAANYAVDADRFNIA